VEANEEPTRKIDPIDVERFIQAFEVFDRTFIPENASHEQREAMLRAFFAGGAMIVGTFQKQIAEGYSIERLKESADFMQSDIMSELALRNARMQ
jgi:hypothetical protein